MSGVERVDLYAKPAFTSTYAAVFRIGKDSPTYKAGLEFPTGTACEDFKGEAHCPTDFDIGCNEFTPQASL